MKYRGIGRPRYRDYMYSVDHLLPKKTDRRAGREAKKNMVNSGVSNKGSGVFTGIFFLIDMYLLALVLFA
jgi:hypothetical protein